MPFLNSTNVHDGAIDQSTLTYITEEKAGQITKGRVRPLDVVMTTRGSIGKVALCPLWLETGLINAQMLILRADGAALDPRFLFQVMRGPSFQQEVKNYASGSAQPQIPIRDLRAVPFSAPPLHHQRSISSILSAYDDLIENNTRRIAVLEEMARRVYEEWFVHFRVPGHEGCSFDGGLPEAWKAAVLGDLVSEIRDGVHPSQVAPDTPYVGLEHLPRRSITLIEWATAASVGSAKLLFTRGDILFGKIRPYFHKVAVAPIDGVCSTDTILLRPDDQRFLPLALCCTSSDAFVAHATQTSNGTKMPRADWKVLQNYPVSIPPEDILSKFNRLVDGIIGQARVLMLKNTNLRAQRDLLLPKLISGEIDVSAAAETLEAAQ